jgi:ABC-type dipeptide/oligopeptide/nickel transport system permease subunit
MDNQHKSPSYYVRKRLLSNKAAVFGLIIIVAAHLIAVLGYLVMPDNTPNANDRAVQLQKLVPGQKVTILKFRENREVKKVNIFRKLAYGQDSEYSIIPISSYRIEDLTIYAKIFAEESEQDVSFDLVDAVLPLYTGKSVKFGGPGKLNYRVDGNQVIYLDYFEQVKRISKAELARVFKTKNIETRRYWLGTDKAGRDVLSMLIFGTRISLSIGLMSMIISLVLGITLGSIAGFFGGKIDAIIMWLMTVVWSIPGIMLVVAISLALQTRGVGVAFVAIGLTTWVEIARVVRGQILSIKEKQFIEAAKAFGIKNFRIIYYHILPNMLGPLIVIAASNYASAILMEAGLSFLGLSVQSPTPSWGIMIFEGFHAIGTENSWHLVLLPSLVVSIVILAFNLFGNGLRDAYDPKTVLK